MNQRDGWIILAIGLSVCLAAWCAFALALHVYIIDFGRQVFGL